MKPTIAEILKVITVLLVCPQVCACQSDAVPAEPEQPVGTPHSVQLGYSVSASKASTRMSDKEVDRVLMHGNKEHSAMLHSFLMQKKVSLGEMQILLANISNLTITTERTPSTTMYRFPWVLAHFWSMQSTITPKREDWTSNLTIQPKT